MLNKLSTSTLLAIMAVLILVGIFLVVIAIADFIPAVPSASSADVSLAPGKAAVTRTRQSTPRSPTTPPRAKASRTPDPSPTPCPALAVETELPVPDVRENYVGRRFDTTVLPKGVKFEYSARYPSGGNLIVLTKNNGDRLLWIVQHRCGPPTHIYYEVVDALIVPPLGPAQTQADSCEAKEGDFNISEIIAVGQYNQDAPPDRINFGQGLPINGLGSTRHPGWFDTPDYYGWQLPTIDWAWRIDFSAGKFVQVPPEKLTCIKYTDKDFSPTPIPRVIAGEFDLTSALRILYGNEGIVQARGNETIVRIAPKNSRQEAIEVLLAAPFRENDVDKYVVFTGTGPDGAGGHPEQAQIGGAIFYKIDNTWQIAAEQRHITDLGTFGHAPRGELIKIGPDKYGFLFRSMVVYQGIGTENTLIFTAMAGGLSTVFHEQTLGTDGLTGETYSSRMEIFPGGDSDYYDIRVTRSGTKLVSDKKQPFERTIIYTFAETKYQPD